MRNALLIGIVLASAPWAAVAQSTAQNALNLNFPSLASAADKKSEIDLDPTMLGIAQQFTGGKNATPLSGVQEVHVRHYEFSAAAAWKDSELESLRRQVTADHAWHSIVNAKEQDENTNVYLLKRENGDSGLLVISEKSKEVNVVEILGPIDLNQMKELVGSTIHYDLPADALASVDVGK